MAVISALDSDPVADDGLNHKRVLKVTNPVALLCLTPVDTWKREEFTRSVCEVELCSVHNTPTAIMPTSFHFQSAAVIPDKSRPYMYSGGSLLHHFMLQSKTATTKISLMCITTSSVVCGCVHCSVSDSHSRKYPGCTHTQTLT